MKFAIRDDDTAYFTKPEELEEAYDFISNGCISLSVVPYTVPIHKDDVFPYGRGIAYDYYDIENNQNLVDYLRKNIKGERFEVLLHGYSHEYKKIDETWKAEMLWKTKDQLVDEFTKGKSHLENVLKCRIRVFVAPNNLIDQKAISAIEELNMDYSGIIQFGDRNISIKYIKNLIKRWGVRLMKKIPYPGVLDFGKHKELVAYTLDSFDRLKLEYMECKKKKEPFVVYTHYWQLNSSPEKKELLKKIYEYAIADGAELVGLSECFRGNEK